MVSRMEVPDSDSDFSDDELPSLDALLNTQPKSSGSVGTVFQKSTRLKSSDRLKSEDNREQRWAELMELIEDAEEDDEVDRMQQEAAAEVPRRSPSAGAEDRQGFLDHAVHLVKGDRSDEEPMDSDEDHHWSRMRQAMDRQGTAQSAPSYCFFINNQEPGEDVVKCKCGSKEENGNMIECETCKTWQHIECCYPDNQKQASQPDFAHWCEDCKPPAQQYFHYIHETLGPARPRHFGLALHTNMATKMPSAGRNISLPDEMLLWILRTLLSEASERIREEYTQILLEHPRQIRKLVDVEQIKRLFLKCGATEEAVTLRVKYKVSNQREPTSGRDWTTFLSVMSLLRTCCGSFGTDTLICAVVLLLRASMDNEVRINATISTGVTDTLMALISAVNRSRRACFCEKVCEQLVTTVESSYLLSRAIEATHHFSLHLPSLATFSPSHDLRTRLQLAVFFQTPTSMHHTLSPSCLLESIISRLDEPAFRARPGVRGDLNFYDLDGYGHALSEIIPYIYHLRQPIADRAVLKDLDESVNTLRRKVNWITSTIQINGPWDDYDARYEAKNRWTSLDGRISYFFPRRGAGVFGKDDAERKEKERRALKKGEEFMAGFVGRRKKEEPVAMQKNIQKTPTKPRPVIDGRALVLSPKKLILSPKKPLKSGKDFMAKLSSKRKAATELGREEDAKTEGPNQGIAVEMADRVRTPKHTVRAQTPIKQGPDEAMVANGEPKEACRYPAQGQHMPLEKEPQQQAYELDSVTKPPPTKVFGAPVESKPLDEIVVAIEPELPHVPNVPEATQQPKAQKKPRLIQPPSKGSQDFLARWMGKAKN
ncbi:hypothetical protein DL546_001185 [Coniochaeta pulveracea]|uniref:Zinc finger PHD-type domain-containing protein n=1 Tax=Coniochaeta pulveracea TaxID=177199 RepID=A0A420YBX6_9PEZI|nr:hypothetical protein DL546_001185 [Coniochaeta pulveracea]